jgi:hypothetical protein
MPPVSTGPTPTLPNGTGGTQLGDGNNGEPNMMRQGAAASFTTTSTITTDQLLTGLLEYTGAGHTLTLPTAALLDAAVPSAGVDNAFDFSITATTGTATLAVGTGITAAAGCRLTTAAATVSRYRLRRTAAAAWTLYLIG